MHSMDGSVGTQRFLVWHRVYLTRLEAAIRYAGYQNFFIPYWDWTKNPNIPNWLKSFTPTVWVPDQEIIPPPPPAPPVNYTQVIVYMTPGPAAGISPSYKSTNQ
jgi:Common central domain of tyrosinase